MERRFGVQHRRASPNDHSPNDDRSADSNDSSGAVDNTCCKYKSDDTACPYDCIGPFGVAGEGELDGSQGVDLDFHRIGQRGVGCPNIGFHRPEIEAEVSCIAIAGGMPKYLETALTTSR